MHKQDSNRVNRHGYAEHFNEKPTLNLLRSRHNSRSQHSSPMTSSGSSFEQSFCGSKYSGIKTKRQSLLKQSQKCSQCISHRSSSRQKILEGKIDHMLKQQEGKIMEITNGRNANQIKFVNCKIVVNKQGKQDSEVSTMRSRRKILDDDDGQNKQNVAILNRKQSFQPNLTQKSNKLTLRNYLNNTNSMEQKFNLQEDLSSINQSKKSKKNDAVLQEVRQLKQMFLEMMNKKQESKTRKKPNKLMKNWEEQPFQNLTLP